MKELSISVSKRLPLLVTAFRFFVGALLALTVGSGVSSADEVSDWNQVMLLATLTASVTPAPVTTRVAAIVQAAVFDAINGIDRHYDSVHVPPGAPPGASKRAAAVQAAYATLVNLFPNEKMTFDLQRAASLAAITDTNDAVQQGLSWGQKVADQIWTWRSQDGFFQCAATLHRWNATGPVAANSASPGARTGAAIGDHYSVGHSVAFSVPHSGSAGDDQRSVHGRFQRVKSMGSSTNSGRTADQTLFAKFWQAGNPPDYFDPVVISLAAQHQFSMSRTARLLALVNLGTAERLSVVGTRSIPTVSGGGLLRSNSGTPTVTTLRLPTRLGLR